MSNTHFVLKVMLLKHYFFKDIFNFSINREVAGEKIWCFFQTTTVPVFSEGEKGIKQVLLSPKLFINFSKQIAYPIPSSTNIAAL